MNKVRIVRIACFSAATLLLLVLRAAREMLLERGGLVFSEVEKGIGAKWDKIQLLRKGQSVADNALKFTA